jgi:hypothetical protein
MKINGQLERYYLHRLLVENPSNSFIGHLRELKNRITRSKNNEYCGKRELADYLTNDPRKSNSNAYNFIDKLESHGCIEVVGKEKRASKRVDIIRVNKKKLRQEVYDSDTYQQELPLWRHLINKNNDF